nr:hypothetical protein HK105_002349 [Polyrhizophydium stewartii]
MATSPLPFTAFEPSLGNALGTSFEVHGSAAAQHTAGTDAAHDVALSVSASLLVGATNVDDDMPAAVDAADPADPARDPPADAPDPGPPPKPLSARASARQRLVGVPPIIRRIVALHTAVKKHVAAYPFLEPVDPERHGCPDYLTVIAHPMDLQTISAKLEAGDYAAGLDPANFAHHDAIVTNYANDVVLMLSNCFKYNPVGHVVHEAGKQLARFFDMQMTNVFGSVELDWKEHRAMASPADASATLVAGRKRRQHKTPTKIYEPDALAAAALNRSHNPAVADLAAPLSPPLSAPASAGSAATRNDPAADPINGVPISTAPALAEHISSVESPSASSAPRKPARRGSNSGLESASKRRKSVARSKSLSALATPTAAAAAAEEPADSFVFDDQLSSIASSIKLAQSQIAMLQNKEHKKQQRRAARMAEAVRRASSDDVSAKAEPAADSAVAVAHADEMDLGAADHADQAVVSDTQGDQKDQVQVHDVADRAAAIEQATAAQAAAHAAAQVAAQAAAAAAAAVAAQAAAASHPHAQLFQQQIYAMPHYYQQAQDLFAQQHQHQQTLQQQRKAPLGLRLATDDDDDDDGSPLVMPEEGYVFSPYSTGGLDTSVSQWSTGKNAKRTAPSTAASTASVSSASSLGAVGSRSRPTARPRQYHSDRVCEFCGATETPMWRRGPSGKSSLCNKCGVKWRSGRPLVRPDGSVLEPPSPGTMSRPTKASAKNAQRNSRPVHAPAAASMPAYVRRTYTPSARYESSTALQRRLVANVLASGALPGDHLDRVVDLIRASMPGLRDSGGEIELDIEAMDATLIQNVYDYITKTAGVSAMGSVSSGAASRSASSHQQSAATQKAQEGVAASSASTSKPSSASTTRQATPKSSSRSKTRGAHAGGDGSSSSGAGDSDSGTDSE